MLPRELNAGARERGFCLNGTRRFKGNTRRHLVPHRKQPAVTW